MTTDHDTYLHKVASAPVKENVPVADTQPFDAVIATDAVTPPRNVLPGELVTSEEDDTVAEFTPSDHDAPPEPKPEPEAASVSELRSRPAAEVRRASRPGDSHGEVSEPDKAVSEPDKAVSEPDIEPILLANGAAIREKWMRLQASFVDDPRAAVAEGAALVSDVLAQLEAAVRARQQPGGDTEALRLQMRQYRLLVDRLTGL